MLQIFNWPCPAVVFFSPVTEPLQHVRIARPSASSPPAWWCSRPPSGSAFQSPLSSTLSGYCQCEDWSHLSNRNTTILVITVKLNLPKNNLVRILRLILHTSLNHFKYFNKVISFVYTIYSIEKLASTAFFKCCIKKLGMGLGTRPLWKALFSQQKLVKLIFCSKNWPIFSSRLSFSFCLVSSCLLTLLRSSVSLLSWPRRTFSSPCWCSHSPSSS